MPRFEQIAQYHFSKSKQESRQDRSDYFTYAERFLFDGWSGLRLERNEKIAFSDTTRIFKQAHNEGNGINWLILIDRPLTNGQVDVQSAYILIMMVDWMALKILNRFLQSSFVNEHASSHAWKTRLFPQSVLSYLTPSINNSFTLTPIS